VQRTTESALRNVATAHPYDDNGSDGTSLRGSTDIVAGELAHEVAERVSLAGVEIVEVRISHLAYAQEIAQAMLRPPAGERGRRRPHQDRRGRPRDGGARTGPPQGEHGEQPHGRSLRRSTAVAGGERRIPVFVSTRRQVLLRVDPAVHDALTRWANDEFRSVNAQVEMLLRRALTEAGRMPKRAAPLPKRGRPRGTGD
jgi:hypothetical protein